MLKQPGVHIYSEAGTHYRGTTPTNQDSSGGDSVAWFDSYHPTFTAPTALSLSPHDLRHYGTAMNHILWVLLLERVCSTAPFVFLPRRTNPRSRVAAGRRGSMTTRAAPWS